MGKNYYDPRYVDKDMYNYSVTSLYKSIVTLNNRYVEYNLSITYPMEILNKLNSNDDTFKKAIGMELTIIGEASNIIYKYLKQQKRKSKSKNKKLPDDLYNSLDFYRDIRNDLAHSYYSLLTDKLFRGLMYLDPFLEILSKYNIK